MLKKFAIQDIALGRIYQKGGKTQHETMTLPGRKRNDFLYFYLVL